MNRHLALGIVLAFLVMAEASFGISECGEISASGRYTLDQDIVSNTSPCIDVTANDVEIDCQGKKILSNGNGAVLARGSGFNLTNCVMEGNLSLASNNQTRCVELVGSSAWHVRSNQFNGCGVGLTVNSGSGNVTSNTFASGHTGIVIRTASGLVVSRNTLTGISRGLEMQGTQNTVVDDLRIEGSRSSAAAQTYAILLDGAFGNTLRNVIITDSDYGLMLTSGSNNNAVLNSTLGGHANATLISGSTGNVFSGNRFDSASKVHAHASLNHFNFSFSGNNIGNRYDDLGCNQSASRVGYFVCGVPGNVSLGSNVFDFAPLVGNLITPTGGSLVNMEPTDGSRFVRSSTVTLSIVYNGDVNPLHVIANVTNSTGEITRVLLLPIGGNKYSGTFITSNHSGRYNVTYAANGTSGVTPVRGFFLVDVPDADRDGFEDSIDTLHGNESSVLLSGINSIFIRINGQSSPQNPSDLQRVEFSDGNDTLLFFSYNFSKSALDLFRISIDKRTDGITVNLNGQENIAESKTMFLADPGFVRLCVKDRAIDNVASISRLCTGSNELSFDSCLTGGSQIISGINCVKRNNVIEISNLSHSGIRGYFDSGSASTSFAAFLNSTSNSTGSGSSSSGSSASASTTADQSSSLSTADTESAASASELLSDPLTAAASLELEQTTVDESSTEAELTTSQYYFLTMWKYAVFLLVAFGGVVGFMMIERKSRQETRV